MTDMPPTNNHFKSLPERDNSDYIENMAARIKEINALLLQMKEFPESVENEWKRVAECYEQIMTDFSNVDWPSTAEVTALKKTLNDLGAMINRRCPYPDIFRVGEHIDALLHHIVRS